jgi:hypothetical protein
MGGTSTGYQRPMITLKELMDPNYNNYVGSLLHQAMERFITMNAELPCLDAALNGDRIYSWYSVKACPYSVHVKDRGHFGAHSFEVYYRGIRLEVVERDIRPTFGEMQLNETSCRIIAERCRQWAARLGHSAAEKVIDDQETFLRQSNDKVKSLRQEIIDQGVKIGKVIHGHQAEKNALHNEITHLRDKLEMQSENFSKAWDMATLGVGKAIPELERLRRKNATLEREVSNLRVKLDTAEGKAKE